MCVGVALDSHPINSFEDKSWLLDVYNGDIWTRGSFKSVQSGGYRSASNVFTVVIDIDNKTV